MKHTGIMDELFDLADLIVTQEGGDVIYEAFEEFVKIQWDVESFFVFSIPKNISKIDMNAPFESFRILYNKKKLSKIKNKSLFKKVSISLCKDFLKEHKKKCSYNLENKKIFAFEALLKNDQVFLCILNFREVNSEKLLKSTEFDRFIKIVKAKMLQVFVMTEIMKLSSLVHIDDVTGLFNQRKLYKDLDYAVERYHKKKEHFCVLFIDVDHFKNVNDGHGHLIGTWLLLELGKILKQNLRESDLIYRYGGDEFVMILPDCIKNTAQAVGARILTAVKKHHFHPQGEREFNLSVSIGVAEFPEHANTKEDILTIADKMMYQAKNKGRGKVCMAEDIVGFENMDKCK